MPASGGSRSPVEPREILGGLVIIRVAVAALADQRLAGQSWRGRFKLKWAAPVKGRGTARPRRPATPVGTAWGTGGCRRHCRGPGVRLAPLPQRLAAQRRRHTEQRITARVAGLGFADVGDYLTD